MEDKTFINILTLPSTWIAFPVPRNSRLRDEKKENTKLKFLSILLLLLLLLLLDMNPYNNQENMVWRKFTVHFKPFYRFSLKETEL